MKLTKDKIITAAVDIFGYSESDFEGMGYKELRSYLEDQIGEIESYYGK